MEANTTEVRTTYTQTTIETAIGNWTRIRNSDIKVETYLNQGNCFSITKEQFEKWNTYTPERLHVYMGIFDGVLKFIMVDNVTDSNEIIDFDYVFVSDYTYGSKLANATDLPTNTEPTVQEGLERQFRWQMTKSNWISEHLEKENGIFQAFRIPYTDLTDLFHPGCLPEVNILIGVIGLRLEGVPDIILWNNVTHFSPSTLGDMALPIPPFSAENPETLYQLLVQSI